MPELNFKITGDDSELKKTLANIAKVAKENGDKISKEVLKSTDLEVKSREKAVKATQEQKKSSAEVVKAAQAEAKAQDRVAEAIRRKNAAFDSTGKQIRPVQMSSSLDEVNAAKAGSVGTITSGTVVGPAVNFNKLANEASAYGLAAKEAHNAAVTGATSTAQANERIRKAIASLKIELQSYKNVAESTKDVDRLAQYNNKIAATQAEIARLRNVGKQGFDELGNKLTVTAGKQQILTDKLRMYQDALNRAKAPQSFVNLNRKIEETQGELARLQNAGKKGFDEMGNAVQKSSGHVGKLWSGLKTVANILPGLGIAGLLAFAIDPIVNYVKNLEIFKKTAKEVITETAIDSSEYKQALTSVTALKTSIDQYHKGLVTGKEVVKEYNEGIGKTAGELKNVTQVEDFYNSQADDFVQAMFLRAQAQAALIASTDALAEAQKRAAGGNTIIDYAKAFGSLTWGGGFGALANITNTASDIRNADIEDLNKKGKDAIALFKKLQEESNKFNKTNNFNFNQDGGSTGVNAIITQQESLQKRIADIRAEYTRKALTKDDEELQSVRDKFKKIIDEATKFNSNPKNRLHLVDTSGLTELRDRAIKDLEYRQGTERTKIDLEKQKTLYAEYEEYKTKLGRDAADARFGREINAYITYLDVLKSKQKEIADIAPEKRTGVQSDYLKWLDAQVAAEVAVEQKKYDALVKEFISYSDQRKALIEKYQADISQMESKGDDTSERTQRFRDELHTLDDANVQKLDAYKALFNGIDRLSDESARKVIANAERMLDSLLKDNKISKELADKIRLLIKDTDKSLKERMPERLINLANQIDLIASSVGGVDAAFGKMLSTLGNVVGQVGNIKKGLADMKTAQGNGDALGQLGAGLGIFGAGLSIVSTVSKLFDKSAEREAQAAYSREMQNKQTEAMNKALERQIALINEAYGTDKILRYQEAIKKATDDQLKYSEMLEGRLSLTGDKKNDEAILRLNALSREERAKTKLNSWTEAYRLPTDIEALQDLLENGKLDSGTAVVVENFIKAKQAVIDLNNALNAETIGTSLSSLADDFIKTLTDGTQDFGKSFEDIIRTSILNGFKGRLIEQQLQSFYTQFAEASKDGSLTEAEIANLRAIYINASEKAKKDLEDLAKATGVSLTDDSVDKSPNSLAGSFATASQESIDLLRGQFAGMRLAQLEANLLIANGNTTARDILLIFHDHLQSLLRIEGYTGRTAANTDRLAAMERALVSIDRKIAGNGDAAKAAGF